LNKQTKKFHAEISVGKVDVEQAKEADNTS
jgi:hypothetical protein